MKFDAAFKLPPDDEMEKRNTATELPHAKIFAMHGNKINIL